MSYFVVFSKTLVGFLASIRAYIVKQVIAKTLATDEKATVSDARTYTPSHISSDIFYIYNFLKLFSRMDPE